MDSQPVMDRMKIRIKYLEDRRADLDAMVKNRNVSNALLKYRLAMEVATKRLQADKVPITLIKDRARGMCAEDEAEWEHAQIEYKANIVMMEMASKELNALQSMNRVTDSI